MLLRESERTPVVLVVENVHWIDASSEEFLKSLADGLHDHRALLVLTTRPGRPMAWLPATTETITLEGLDLDDLRQMVHTLLGTRAVSAALLQILLAKGEGNPLYVEEILRQLQEMGGILVEDGEARLRAADVTVPETIRDIIAARVDRLVESPKHTLQVARWSGGASGSPWCRACVTAIAIRSRRTSRIFMARTSCSRARSDPELMYSFKHALTQDVVYCEPAGAAAARCTTRRPGAASRSCTKGGSTRWSSSSPITSAASAEDDKAVDYALRRGREGPAAMGERRGARALRKRPEAPRHDARHPGNRLRRIDAVVKQAEVKFALGRHAEHVEALEADQATSSTRSPILRGGPTWYYWTGFLQSLVGGRPEKPIAVLPRGLAPSPTPAGSTRSGPSPNAVSPTS